MLQRICNPLEKDYQRIANPLERVISNVIRPNYFGYTATIGIFRPKPNALEETRSVGGA